jgi:glycosyltransferase involved in cell wall biosynthesis
MNIVQVFNSVGLNGPEMLVLPAMVNAGWLHEIWSLHETRHGEYNEFEAFCNKLNLPVRRINVARRIDPSAIEVMRRMMEPLGNHTVFHSHDAKASIYTWAALSAHSRFKRNNVVTHHGALARPDTLSRLYECLFTQGARMFASKILCVCKEDFEILLKRGIPKAKLELHINGIDRPPLSWNDRRSTAVHEISRLAIAARLSPEKNHKRLFDVAFKMNSLRSFPWTIDVLGDGNLMADLVAYCQRIGIEKQIRFVGYCNEAWRTFDQYDCLLNFSLGEGAPISLLEAGWRTTPAFVSAVGGTPNLCGPHGAEYFDLSESDSEIAERLAQFCLDENKRRSTAQSLFTRVKNNYSQSHWLTSVEKIYQNVLGVSL